MAIKTDANANIKSGMPGEPQSSVAGKSGNFALGTVEDVKELKETREQIYWLNRALHQRS